MEISAVLLAALILIGAIAGGLWGCPRYEVYSKEMTGHAEYAMAESTRKVKVLEAQAKLDAAKLEAQSDVERAKGVAAANEIVVKGLGGPDNYLKWKYIQMLEDHGKAVNREVIYIPTEGGIPIMEAGRLQKKQ
jgi:regulator of protease activity HflC (stomatin/prohibitin superfamily)